MKKLFTFLVSAGFVAASWGAYTVPYLSPMADPSTEGPAEGWTVIDIDGDGGSGTKANGKWSFCPATITPSNYMGGPCMIYYYHASNAANDWLVSPAIHLTAGVTYKVRYQMYANGTGEKMRVVLTSANDQASLFDGTTLDNMNPITPGSTLIKKVHPFTVDADGDYYIGFYAYSDKNKWYIGLNSFSIMEDVFAPAPVTGLTVAAGTTDNPRALQATLSWTNPSTDIDDLPFEEGVSVESIKVFRDNVLVATLTGTETSWTDTAAAGLTNGIHTYSVVAVVNSTESASTSITSGIIGTPPAVSLPFASNFTEWAATDASKALFYQNWTRAQGPASTISTNWEISKPYAADARLTFRTYSNEIIHKNPEDNNLITEDSWIITPPITFSEPGTYTVELNAAVSQLTDGNNTPARIRLCYGNESSATAMTNVIDNNVPLVAASNRPADSHFYSVTITEPGDYFFGVAAAAENIKYSLSYYIYALNIERYSVRPSAVSNLTATPDSDEALGVTLSWTNPTLDITGTPLTAPYKIQILRGEEQVAEFTNTPGSAETTTYHDALASPGCYTYSLRACDVDGNFADNAIATVTTPWIGSDTVEVPYSVDFTTSAPSIALWSVDDADNDNRTWELTSYGYRLNPAAPEYDYDDPWGNYSYTNNQDYLISPKLTLTPGEYTLTCSAKGDDQTFHFGLIADGRSHEIPSLYVANKQVTGTSNVASPYTLTANVEAAGDYRFVIYSKNDYNDYVSISYAITVSSASIVKKQTLPALATNVSVAPAAAPQLEATVSWTNPAVTSEGATLTELEKAIVYRDGEAIATLTDGIIPGAVSQYVDNTVPEAGKYTYMVEVYTADGKSPLNATTVLSAWIGGGLDLPFEDTDFSDWTILNANNDFRVIPDDEFGDYEEERTWQVGYNGLSIQSNVTGGTTDDWAFSPRLNLEEGTTYELEISSCVGYGNATPYLFDVAIGNDDAPEAMTQLATLSCEVQLKADAQTDVITIKAVSADEPATLANDDENIINVPAGVMLLGIHANRNGALTLTKVVAKAKANISDGVADITSDGIFALDGDNILLPAGTRALTLCTLNGQVLLNLSCPTECVSLSNLSRGAYILTVTAADGSRYSAKFLR